MPISGSIGESTPPGPVLDEIVDVDEVGPARLAQRVDDRRAFGIDEVLPARLGQHERLGVVEHLQLEAGVAEVLLRYSSNGRSLSSGAPTSVLPFIGASAAFSASSKLLPSAI